MNALIEKVRNNPVLATSMASAVIALVVSFGVHLSDEQVGAVMAVVVAVLGFVARSQVTPTRSIPEPSPEPEPEAVPES